MRHRRTAAIGFAATLALAACAGSDEPTLDAGAGEEEPATASSGSDNEPTSDPASDPAAEAAEDAAASAGDLTIADIDVPDVEVLSVPSGEMVNVAEIALGQDTLFWFYAPH